VGIKRWWQSKTIWLNVIVGGLASLEATTGMLQPFLPEHWYVAVAVGLPIVNVALRTITTQGVRR
jgi:small ligand-binding sensory domain FIST